MARVGHTLRARPVSLIRRVLPLWAVLNLEPSCEYGFF